MTNIVPVKERAAQLCALIDDKLESAKTAQRVSAFKAEEAVKAAGVSEDVKKKLEEVADVQIKAKGRITRPTGSFQTNYGVRSMTG